MSDRINKPMDVYSTFMWIPFDVAAWCRGRKFSPVAVQLSKAIRKVDDIDAQIASLQAERDEADKAAQEAIKAVQDKMAVDPI